MSYVVTTGFTDWHVHTALFNVAELKTSVISRVFDLGANPQQLATKISQKRPEIIYAGAFLTAKNGYPSDRDWAEEGSWRFVTDATAAKAHVTEMAKIGAAAIKIALNSNAGPVLSDAMLNLIIKEANLYDLPVIVHAEGTGQAQRARLAGAKYLAHTPFSEILSDAEIALQAKTVSWISTLDIHGWGDLTDSFHSENFHNAITNLKKFQQAGGRVLYGTDMGNGPTITGLNHREIAALKLAGLSDKKILAALTGTGHTFINDTDIVKPAADMILIPAHDGELDFINARSQMEKNND